MILTAKSRYALILMIDIAIFSGGRERPVTIRSTSDRHSVSIRYLEQICLCLRKRELIAACKGPGGGYWITKPFAEITLFHIVEAVGESLRLNKCQSNSSQGCSMKGERCVIHGLLDDLTLHILGYLQRVTLQSVLDGYVAAAR